MRSVGQQDNHIIDVHARAKSYNPRIKPVPGWRGAWQRIRPRGLVAAARKS
jgi:hypothetical protein